MGKSRRFLPVLVLFFLVQRPAIGQQPIHWDATIDSAKVAAGQSNRLVLVLFSAPWCTACHHLENDIRNQPGAVAALEANFVPVKINYDYYPNTAKQYGVTRLPTTVILAPNARGDVLAVIPEYMPVGSVLVEAQQGCGRRQTPGCGCFCPDSGQPAGRGSCRVGPIAGMGPSPAAGPAPPANTAVPPQRPAQYDRHSGRHRIRRPPLPHRVATDAGPANVWCFRRTPTTAGHGDAAGTVQQSPLDLQEASRGSQTARQSAFWPRRFLPCPACGECLDGNRARRLGGPFTAAGPISSPARRSNAASWPTRPLCPGQFRRRCRPLAGAGPFGFGPSRAWPAIRRPCLSCLPVKRRSIDSSRTLVIMPTGRLTSDAIRDANSGRTIGRNYVPSTIFANRSAWTRTPSRSGLSRRARRKLSSAETGLPSSR